MRIHDRTDDPKPSETPVAHQDPAGHPSTAAGLMPDTPRQGGIGPLTEHPWPQKPYEHPAAGWGTAKSVMSVLARAGSATPWESYIADYERIRVATSRDGSQRALHRYRTLEYNLPRGSAAGYMPEMNVLISAADYSAQSDQPLMKHIRVRVTLSGSASHA